MAFININALTVFKFETGIAFTYTLVVFLDTVTMFTTIDTLTDIDFIAFVNSVTRETSFAFTGEAAFVVDAVCLGVAVVRIFGTFVNVITLSAIVNISESSGALTCVTANCVGTCCKRIALVSSLVTFVNGDTFSFLQFKTSVANACWSIILFYAGTASATVVVLAVIDVIAVNSITREASLTFACKTATGVSAIGILVTVMCITSAHTSTT